MQVYDALEPPTKQRTRAELLARVRKPDTAPTELMLAAGLLPDTADNLDAFQSEAEAVLDAKEETYLYAITSVALSLAPTRSAKAGELACRAIELWIPSFIKNESYPTRTTAAAKQALLVIGHARTPCKAVDIKKEDYSRLLIGCSFDDGWKLCTQKELTAKIAEEIARHASMKGANRRVELRQNELLLAGYYVRGPLPKELLAAAKRKSKGP